MGRDEGVIQSSILMLQERFRQLHREKEMREKREILKMFSEAKGKSNYCYSTSSAPSSYSNTTSSAHAIASSRQYHDPFKFFLHPELVRPAAADHHPQRPLIDDIDVDEFRLSHLRQCSKGKNVISSGESAVTKANVHDYFFDCNKKFDDPASDVDTSLHL